MAPRYRVTLAEEERQEMEALTRAATKTTGKRFLYARALLLCDRGRGDRAGVWPEPLRPSASRPARSSASSSALSSRAWKPPWSASGACGRPGR